MFKRVLVPVDGSQPSMHAIAAAREVTDPRSGTVLLVTVVEPGVLALHQPYVAGLNPYEANEPPAIIPKLSRDRAFQAAELLVLKGQEILTSAGIRSEGKVLSGSPVDQILAEANRWPAEIIVIGSHGLGGVSRLILGSVSSKVLERAQVPVLI